MNTKNLKRIAFATVAGIILGVAPGARAENLDRAGAGIGGGAGGGGSDIIINGGTVTTHGGGVGEVDEAMVKLIAQDEAAEAAAPKVDKSTTVNGQSLSNNVVISTTTLGLGNVDNTRDLDKPVSTAVSNLLTSSYLPLAGGTMTGTITSGPTIALKRSADDSRMLVYGGTDWNSGAFLALHGVNDSASWPGCFRLSAYGSGNTKQLIGKPDGHLRWSGNSLDVGDATGNTFIEAADGGNKYTAYICGGYGTNGGAYLYLNGKSKSSNAGGFGLTANNGGATTNYFQGWPDGRLTWSGSDLVAGPTANMNVKVSNVANTRSDVYFLNNGSSCACLRVVPTGNVEFKRKASTGQAWYNGPGFNMLLDGSFQIQGTDSAGANGKLLTVNSTGMTYDSKKVLCHTEYLSGTGAITLATGMSTPSGFVTSVAGNWMLVSGLIGTIAPGSSSGWVTIGTLKTARTVGVVATGCGMVYSGTAGFVAVPIQITTGKLLQYYWTSNLGTSNMSNMRINITAILSN